MSRAAITYLAAFIACCTGAWAGPAAATDEDDPDALAKKLSNPVASLISVPFQMNWDTGLAENGLGEKYLLNPVGPCR